MSEQVEYQGMLYEPYLDWCAAEGLPIVEEFCVDLHKVETQPWARTGARGAFVYLKGRGDFIAINLHELPAGGETVPQRHLIEEVFLVIEGHGSAVVENAAGARHSFEWGPNSLFSVPLNARYQLFNGSGSQPARLASTNDLPLKMNLLHDEDFIFATDWRFADREGPDASYFEGGGEMVAAPRGRQMWETNFISDMTNFELHDWASRGAGSANLVFCLADGNIHAHCSEMSVGTYKKAHRHGPDFACLHRLGVGPFAVLARRRRGLHPPRLGARLGLRADRDDLPPALQHRGPAGALRGDGDGLDPLPIQRREEGDQDGRRRQRQ